MHITHASSGHRRVNKVLADDLCTARFDPEGTTTIMVLNHSDRRTYEIGLAPEDMKFLLGSIRVETLIRKLGSPEEAAHFVRMQQKLFSEERS